MSDICACWPENGQLTQTMDDHTRGWDAVRLLEKRDHIVVVASNGREVLAALGEQSFDLVLMDVQMPEMAGFEATTAIRDREKTTGEHLQIIATTAHAMKGD